MNGTRHAHGLAFSSLLMILGLFPFGLLSPGAATIATVPRDADENDASSNQNPHLEFSPGVGSHDCAMNSWMTCSAGNCAQVMHLGGPARP
jgi:hypothetical protein